MGEVIRPDSEVWGRRIPSPENENNLGGDSLSKVVSVDFTIKPEADKSNANDRLECSLIAAVGSSFGEIAPTIIECIRYFNDQKGDISRTIFHEHAASFSEKTDADLFKIMENSSVSEWAKNPAFYKALCSEIVIRINSQPKNKAIRPGPNGGVIISGTSKEDSQRLGKLLAQALRIHLEGEDKNS